MITDPVVEVCSSRLGTAGHYRLRCIPEDRIQCIDCQETWILGYAMSNVAQITPCASTTGMLARSAFTESKMSATTDPELIPLGNTWETEDTKPGVIIPPFMPFEGVEFEEEKPKTCECGVDAIGGGVHSSWCPKKE
jgi:hypothetical protein